jgi:hypothetical protein
LRFEEVKDAIEISDTKVAPLKTTFSSGEKAPGDLYDEKLEEIEGLDSNANTKITSLMNAVDGIKEKLPESADKDVKEIKALLQILTM